MNGALFEIGLVVFMLAVGGAFLVWYWKYRAAGSQRRMTQMLTRAGVAPEVINRGDVEAIIKDVRRRCRTCNSEDLCERWLAGKVEGENDFCPNEQIFRGLARANEPVAP